MLAVGVSVMSWGILGPHWWPWGDQPCVLPPCTWLLRAGGHLLRVLLKWETLESGTSGSVQVTHTMP